MFTGPLTEKSTDTVPPLICGELLISLSATNAPSFSASVKRREKEFRIVQNLIQIGNESHLNQRYDITDLRCIASRHAFMLLPTQTGSDWFHVPLSRQILTALPTSTNPFRQLYFATDPGVLTEGRVSILLGGGSSREHSITAGEWGGGQCIP